MKGAPETLGHPVKGAAQAALFSPYAAWDQLPNAVLLFDLTTDTEHFYQTSSELVSNAKKYLDILTVSYVS